MIPAITTQRLCRVIAGFHPASVLCLGAGRSVLFDPCREALPACRIDERTRAPSLEELESDEPHDLILIADLLEHQPRADAEQLMARLRDLGAPRLILALPRNSDWPLADLLSLGLVLLGDLETDNRQLRLYAFDIASYKTTPDWLNSRFWAHPELWGKYWW